MIKLLNRFFSVFLTVTVILMGASCGGQRRGAVEAVREPRAMRLLVMGRDRAAGLTDSIMLVSLNETEGCVRILQIPRDTYAEYTDRDYKKLNGAFSRLGLKGTKDFLSGALGISIHYAVCMDLEAVSELVDAVGGVEVEIPEEMHYSDPAQALEIHFPKGLRRLDGREATLFLRYRSGYADADLGRMQAQRQFLQSFTEQCGRAESAVLVSAMLRVLSHVQTDLPIQEMIRLFGGVSEGDTVSLIASTAPGEAVKGHSGAWYYCLNRAGMLRATRELLLGGEVLSEESFDEGRVFDREENPDFHNVYIAPPRG